MQRTATERVQDTITQDRLAVFKQQHKQLGSTAYRIHLIKGEKTKVFSDKPLAAENIEQLIHHGQLQKYSGKDIDVVLEPIAPKHHFIVLDDLPVTTYQAMLHDGYQPAYVQSLDQERLQIVLKVKSGATEDEAFVVSQYLDQLAQRYDLPEQTKAKGIYLSGFTIHSAKDTLPKPMAEQVSGYVCPAASIEFGELKDKYQQDLSDQMRQARLAVILEPQIQGPKWKRFFAESWSRLYRMAKAVFGNDDVDPNYYPEIDRGSAKACLQAGMPSKLVIGAIETLSPSMESTQREVRHYSEKVLKEALHELKPDHQRIKSDECIDECVDDGVLDH